MDVKDYRNNVAAEINTQLKSGDQGLAATSQPAADEAGDIVTDSIAMLADKARSAEDRLKAFQLVQSATFSGGAFNKYQLPYREALRAVATDTDQRLREKALEALALRQDDYARELLLIGLNDGKQALVSAAKAIQFLGYDDHGVAVPAAKQILAGDHEVGAKNEALRVLAKDPASAEIFAEFMRDRSQPELLRATSATGLRLTDPALFVLEAQRIVADETEADSVRANSLGALGHLQGRGTIGDKAFQEKVLNLENSSSIELKAAAQRFTKGTP